MTLETYNKSTDKLLDAYNAGELFHGRCDACAVGTLLGTQKWMNDFVTSNGKVLSDGDIRAIFGMDKMTQFLNKSELVTIYKDNGFTREELVRIENAFEMSIYNTSRGYSYYAYEDQKKGQFIGLTAVLKVMSEMVETTEPLEDKQTRLVHIAKEKGVLI